MLVYHFIVNFTFHWRVSKISFSFFIDKLYVCNVYILLICHQMLKISKIFRFFPVLSRIVLLITKNTHNIIIFKLFLKIYQCFISDPFIFLIFFFCGNHTFLSIRRYIRGCFSLDAMCGLVLNIYIFYMCISHYQHNNFATTSIRY